MSAIFWEVWSANGKWYAYRWYEAAPEYEGPFDTREEATNWAMKLVPYFG